MVKSNKKGFTIIEVVLVLAIAGLIFLMVFIALPALQRSQRNTQRKNDLSRFVTAVTSYQSNNGNKLPSSDYEWNFKLRDRYITAGGDSSQFEDPDGEPYVFNTFSSGPSAGGTNWTPTGISQDFTENIKEVTNYGDGSTHPITGHRIGVYKHSKCSVSEGMLDYSAGKNDVALIMVLEGNSFACADNQ